jgi:hypothetical protein
MRAAHGGSDSQLTNEDLKKGDAFNEEKMGRQHDDSPCRARDSPGCLNSSTEDDELHAVNDGVASDIADEGLYETLECLHWRE